MANYQCRACKHTFEKSTQPKRCPYCEAEEITTPKTAQDFLDEV